MRQGFKFAAVLMASALAVVACDKNPTDPTSAKEETLQKVNDKYGAVRREIGRLEHTGVPASAALNALLTSRGTAEVHDGSPLIALLRRPQNLGQAGRISGVSPADIAALMLYITSKTRE